MREEKYRELKKKLNKYHKFSFDMPRKGKPFSSQQKSAITRQWRKLRGVIENLEKNTYIPYKEGMRYSNVEGLRTNKGLFFALPGATVKVEKKTRKQYIAVKFGEYLEKHITFPQHVQESPALIDQWVKKEIKKIGAGFESAMFLRHLTPNTSRYEEGLLGLYWSAAVDEHKAKAGSIVGVILIYRKVKRVEK